MSYIIMWVHAEVDLLNQVIDSHISFAISIALPVYSSRNICARVEWSYSCQIKQWKYFDHETVELEIWVFCTFFNWRDDDFPDWTDLLLVGAYI